MNTANGAGVLLIGLLGAGLALTIIVFFYMTIARCLSRVNPKNRDMQPGEVWLNLIPLLNLFWIFITVFRVASSLRKEYRARGWHVERESFGQTIGVLYAACGPLGVIPFAGPIFALISFVCLIAYWVQIAGYSKRLLEESGQPEHDLVKGEPSRSDGELAPSILSADDPTAARIIGLAAAVVVIVCGVFLAYNLWAVGHPTADGPRFLAPSAWLTIGLALGLLGLLFHAAYDRDVQFRRLYLIFGGAAFIVGVFFCVLPDSVAGTQFKAGFPCMLLSLIFVLASLRNEDEALVRNPVQLGLGGIGGALFLTGAFGGLYSWVFLTDEFLLPYGLLLALLGFSFVTAFVVTRGISDDVAYWGGWGLGGLGLLVFLLALGWSVIPSLIFSFGWLSDAPKEHLIPSGMILMLLGLAAMVVSVGLCSENRLVILTRRELAGFFFSPISYFVLIGFTVGAWLAFLFGVWTLERQAVGLDTRTLPEPIVGVFIFTLPTVLMIFVIPALTMRLLSEEKRSGTLEVLLTTPTDEWAIVLSKFFASFIMFLTIWLPYVLFFIALYLYVGSPFDYRPLLSFGIGLAFTGAGLLSMGLFFSSLTNSQIVSGILTFAGTLFFMCAYLMKYSIEEKTRIDYENLIVVLDHISFLNVWSTTLDGKLIPKQLLFQGSLAVWWLFLTTKVLEARKWL